MTGVGEKPQPPDEEGRQPEEESQLIDPPGDATAPEDAEEEEALGGHYDAAQQVVERNGVYGTMIVVGGNLNGPVNGERQAAVPILDITAHVETIEPDFVESPCYEPTLKAIEEHAVALLFGESCGNRVTASMALRRSGHEPILELPGALNPAAIVEAVRSACKDEKTGILIDSVEGETLSGFTGFQLRHLRDALPAGAAVVFTSRAHRVAAGFDEELPAIEGKPPDPMAFIDLLVRRRGLDEEIRTRAEETVRLLPGQIGPAIVSDLMTLAESVEAPEELAALIGGRSPALETWLQDRPEAKGVAALAAAATFSELPIADFDAGCAFLTALLEGEVEPGSEPVRFGSWEDSWPPGIVTRSRGTVLTSFGWQETEVVQICPPHQPETVIRFLWSHLGGDFRRPFLQWLRELTFDSGDRLTFAAAKTAGVLFAVDPATIERELLRPWAKDGRVGLRNGVALALGMPTVIGFASTSSRQLLRHWENSSNANLRKAAIAAYGGPLGVYDPSVAAVPSLWSVGWEQPELALLADRTLAALFCGGETAGRARYTAVELLLESAGSKDATRVYSVLPLVFQQLTGGRAMARASFRALLSDDETAARQGLTSLLAMAFDNVKGRDSAQRSIELLVRAAAAGKIGRGDVEQLIREMKDGARKRDRLSQFGLLLRQTLKTIERAGGSVREMARLIQETFYEEEGGKSLETKR